MLCHQRATLSLGEGPSNPYDTIHTISLIALLGYRIQACGVVLDAQAESCPR
ncbi:MAG: hypothetical protein NZ520_09475 [bacterium]|nr:hypothetical protein [bacterium]MCS7310830.1 hypothetical protein [Armatimonadota bacterium]